MKSRAWIHTLLVSALSGAVVWALSSLITGHKEPWDSPGYYYPIALAVAGLLSGLTSPRIKWAYFVGGVVGQLLYAVISLPSGPLIGVGVLFMCIYGLAFLAAALVASHWANPTTVDE
jgi:hypothetical protein